MFLGIRICPGPVAVAVGIILAMTAEDAEERTTSGPLFGKGTLIALFAWGLIVLAFSVGGIADVTRFWWLVLLFGTAAPVVLLVAVRGRSLSTGTVDVAGKGGRELLGALREHGELTPAAAATLTSLTAAGAAKLLERLAREGYLEARVMNGTVVYAMRDRSTLSESSSEPRHREDPTASTPVEPLAESLSDRESAVLELLADGHTNREIAQQLYIAQGTVKAHVASVYRKLEVHSRAEAVSRARDLGLFR
jgi:DNA-binding NarL/FixJ family response regulator